MSGEIQVSRHTQDSDRQKVTQEELMALVQRVQTDELPNKEEFNPEFKYPTSQQIGDYACMDDVVAKATEFVTLQEQLSKL